LQPFEYVIPRDHAEACRLLEVGNGAARAFQGGTDLLVRIRAGVSPPKQVIDLKHLPGMREIRKTDDGWLAIGAACTMNGVAAHPLIRERYQLLAQACNSVASYQLRNRATVGGNCCNASPAADTAPALLCLHAEAELYGPAGIRRLPLHAFFTGPGKTALRSGEFLTNIYLPPSPSGALGVFRKIGRTRIGDISIVNLAVYSWPAADNHCEWRIVLGAVGPTPLRAQRAEAILAADTSSAGVEEAAHAAQEAARPIDDIRASAQYRRAMVRVLALRGISDVLAAGGGK